MENICAISSGGKYVVASISDFGDIHFLGNVRAFQSFDEANEVAKKISEGHYGYKKSNYINMR
jgi:hypothetical protein